MATSLAILKMSIKHKYIKETTIGYYLAIKYHGSKRYSKTFHTIDYGIKENALESAIKERDRFIEANNLTPRRRHDPRDIKGISKTKDVTRRGGKIVSVSWLWQATWVENGKQKTRRFYINKHGEEKAFELAVKAREKGLKAVNSPSATSTLFLPPKHTDVKIWRYMDFTKFVSMLENGGLFFPSVELMDDFFEGSLSRGNEKIRSFVYSRKLNKESMGEIVDRIKKYILLNCWHMGDQESAAMWKIYTQTNESICILSTYRSLRRGLKSNFEIGIVNYIDYNRHWIPEDDIFYPFFYKRESFKHENELRAVINLSDKKNRKFLDEDNFKENKGIWVKLNLSSLIKNIYVSPQSPKWFLDLVEKVSEKYNLKVDVVNSSIDNKPMY